MDNCPHDLAERVSACADGYCPLCMEEKLASIPKPPMAPMDKPAEGLARVELISDQDGLRHRVRLYKSEKHCYEMPLFFANKDAAQVVADFINEANASLVKPLREKAEKLESLLSDTRVRYLKERERADEAWKDRDAWKEKCHQWEQSLVEAGAFAPAWIAQKAAEADQWKEKAAILEKHLEDFGDHHIRMMSLPGPWEEDAARLAETLKRYADKKMWSKDNSNPYLGEVDCFDWANEPHDYENGWEIAEEALTAHEKLKARA